MDAEKSGSGRGLRSALAAAANRIRGRVRQGTTLHSIASIALGSGAGQAVAFLLAIPLARLYGPESFGLYAIFMVVVNSGTAIAGLRYELAIVLPKSDTWAHALYRLSVRSAAAVSATISLGFLVFYWVGGRDLYGGSLGLWLVGAGAAVFFTAGVTFVQYWMNREGDFRVLAKNRFAQAVLVPALQLIFALIWPDLGGLALGSGPGAGVVPRAQPAWRRGQAADQCLGSREAIQEDAAPERARHRAGDREELRHQRRNRR